MGGVDETPAPLLGRLMHDFFCTRAADMYPPLLADRMRQLKETKEGERIMTSVVDEIRGRAIAMAQRAAAR